MSLCYTAQENLLELLLEAHHNIAFIVGTRSETLLALKKIVNNKQRNYS